MANNLLYFNGVNGATGEYGLPPMTGEELSQFIDDLLFIAKTGEALGKHTKISLRRIIDELTERITKLAPQLSLKVSSSLPSYNCDPIRMKQVFENLFMNIVKHAEATEIEIYSKMMENDYYIFVQDNGRGISPEKMKEIQDGLNENSYSSFGLLIVQKIIVAHNGSFELESVEGKGTTVILRLPK